MRDLYPEIAPFDVMDLKVSERHTIHVARYGNPNGQPVLFLHGGPGAGCKPRDARFFDPMRYHAILVDQRGCGESRPFAELAENDTFALVSDMEKVRETLKIPTWLVFGGSWGSTLALAYAVSHPERVQGLILRGIFLGTRREIEHLYIDGASRFFPEEFDAFLAPIPASERGDLIKAYYRRLTDPNPAVRLEAARAWSTWEASILRLVPDPETIREMGQDVFAEPFARIECHYFVNDCFFPEDDWLLKRAHKLANIPGWVVHGRYDVVCAPEAAWKLVKAWPRAKLEIVPNAGHSSTEPGTIDALLRATTEFLQLIGVR